MPLYEYKCDCGEIVERDFPLSDIKQKVKCPACGKMAQKAIVTVPNVICRYSYFERSQGNPRVNRGKGRR